MPEAFEKCIKEGGRVRTMTGPDKEHGLAEGEYMHICYQGDKSYAGEVKKKKKDQ